MNKLNTIIKAIKGGKSQFDKILKANQNLKDLRLDTYLKNGEYCLDIRQYYEDNKEDLKKDFTYKEWFEEYFSNVLFSYTLATKYIKLYEFENKENKFKGHKRKLLRENNFNSLNESLNYIRGKKDETTTPNTKKLNNVLSWYFGDSNIKRSIIEDKGGFKFKFGKDTKTKPNEDILPHIEDAISKLEEVKKFYNVQILKIEHEEVI